MSVRKRGLEIMRRIVELEAEVAPLNAELNKLRRELDALFPEEAEAATGQVSIKQRVAEFIKNSGTTPVTAEILQKELQINNVDTVRSCLSRLQSEGVIKSAARGHYVSASAPAAEASRPSPTETKKEVNDEEPPF